MNLAELDTFSFLQVDQSSNEEETAEELTDAFVQGAAAPKGVAASGPKQGAGAKIIAVLMELKRDVQEDMAVAKQKESTQQADFEKLVEKSTGSRAERQKEILSKREQKARKDAEVQDKEGALASYKKELTAVVTQMAALDDSCADLLANHKKKTEKRRE